MLNFYSGFFLSRRSVQNIRGDIKIFRVPVDFRTRITWQQRGKIVEMYEFFAGAYTKNSRTNDSQAGNIVAKRPKLMVFSGSKHRTKKSYQIFHFWTKFVTNSENSDKRDFTNLFCPQKDTIYRKEQTPMDTLSPMAGSHLGCSWLVFSSCTQLEIVQIFPRCCSCRLGCFVSKICSYGVWFVNKLDGVIGNVLFILFSYNFVNWRTEI